MLLRRRSPNGLSAKKPQTQKLPKFAQNKTAPSCQEVCAVCLSFTKNIKIMSVDTSVSCFIPEVRPHSARLTAKRLISTGDRYRETPIAQRLAALLEFDLTAEDRHFLLKLRCRDLPMISADELEQVAGIWEICNGGRNGDVS